MDWLGSVDAPWRIHQAGEPVLEPLGTATNEADYLSGLPEEDEEAISGMDGPVDAPWSVQVQEVREAGPEQTAVVAAFDRLEYELPYDARDGSSERNPNAVNMNLISSNQSHDVEDGRVQAVIRDHVTPEGGGKDGQDSTGETLILKDANYTPAPVAQREPSSRSSTASTGAVVPAIRPSKCKRCTERGLACELTRSSRCTTSCRSCRGTKSQCIHFHTATNTETRPARNKCGRCTALRLQCSLSPFSLPTTRCNACKITGQPCAHSHRSLVATRRLSERCRRCTDRDLVCSLKVTSRPQTSCDSCRARHTPCVRENGHEAMKVSVAPRPTKCKRCTEHDIICSLTQLSRNTTRCRSCKSSENPCIRWPDDAAGIQSPNEI